MAGSVRWPRAVVSRPGRRRAGVPGPALLWGIAGAGLFCAGAGANVVNNSVWASIGGRCEEALAAGTRADCAPEPLDFQASPGRGSTVLQVKLADGRTLGFVGRGESWPRPGEYRLEVSGVLSEVSVQRTPSSAAAATGECRASVSPDGATWRRLECEAREPSGQRYRLFWRGDGARVVFRQRGLEVRFPGLP